MMKFKQGLAFTVFMTSAAAADSEHYMIPLLLTVFSLLYLYYLVRKEQIDVSDTRRKGIDKRNRRAQAAFGRSDLGVNQRM